MHQKKEEREQQYEICSILVGSMPRWRRPWNSVENVEKSFKNQQPTRHWLWQSFWTIWCGTTCMNECRFSLEILLIHYPTFEQSSVYPPYCNGAETGELTESQLQIEQRETHTQQHRHVRDQKCTWNKNRAEWTDAFIWSELDKKWRKIWGNLISKSL